MLLRHAYGKENVVCESGHWRHWNSIVGSKMLSVYSSIMDSKVLELILG